MRNCVIEINGNLTVLKTNQPSPENYVGVIGNDIDPSDYKYLIKIEDSNDPVFGIVYRFEVDQAKKDANPPRELSEGEII